MSQYIKDFVGVYENAFSHEYCDRVIAEFEAVDSSGFTFDRSGDAPKTLKDDQSFWTGENWNPNSGTETDFSAIHTDLGRRFTDIFWGKCYEDYAKKFVVLSESAKHTIFGNKVQRTNVGQGYHVWHYESGTREVCNRLLTYILYLNDVDEGGETEFLYYPRRVKPKKGTLVLFPAAFTHTHRGNPPISNTKYIVTGWVEF